MPKASLNNSEKLSQIIKQRRLELHLTIEEAAQKADIGTKTWSRYEAGNPIRKDKLDGILRALKWNHIPSELRSKQSLRGIIEKYQKHEAWSDYLYQNYGASAAISFAIGSDILSDYVRDDLDNLSERSKGTHIGELGTSFVSHLLPEQFLMEYNYEFMFIFSKVIDLFRVRAKTGMEIVAHSVLEEICLYIIMEESQLLLENYTEELSPEELEQFLPFDKWAFDILDDMDVYTFLYSDFYLESSNPYHFNHWLDNQFFSS